MRLSLILLALFFSIAVQAQAETIYKWQDATGKLQYTEVPPPSGEYEVINKPPPPSSDPNKVMEDLKSQVEEADKAREEAARQEQEQEQNEDRAELFAKNCEIARKNLTALQGDQPVVRTDDQGNRIVLNTEQREATLRQAQKDVEYYCNP